MNTLKLGLTKGKVTIIDYNEFMWLNQWEWCFCPRSNNKGHAYRKDKYNKAFYMHVELMKKWGLYEEGKEVDHKDRDGLNNTKENLRMATHQENLMNRNIPVNNTSGITGVTFYKNRYVASIVVGDRYIYCGRHVTLEQATKVRREAELKYFGRFAPNIGD